MFMTFLRERAGFVVIGLIGFAIVSFVLTDAFQASSPFLQDSQNEVAVINGEGVSYQEYNEKVEQSANMTRQRMSSMSNSQIQSGAQMQAWSQVKQEILLNKQVELSGVAVGSEELFDMVQGKNPDSQIKQAFSDPQTGQFDPKAVISFLKNMDANDPSGRARQQWLAFERAIQDNKAILKYTNLVGAAIYVTDLEVKQFNTGNSENASVEIVSLPLTSVNDSEFSVSQQDLEKAYNDNKSKYEIKEEERVIEYVVFKVAPSAQDSIDALADIENIKEEFKASTQDSLFYVLNSDTKLPLKFEKKKYLQTKSDSVLVNAKEGTVYGPYIENGAYKVAKLVATKQMPDSVRARHILINTENGGGTEIGRAKADSLMKLVKSGKVKFADLARTASDDRGSAMKGGDLGFFGPNMMVAPFEEAAFGAKKGDLVIAVSQFGTHLIEVQELKGVSKAVKIAVIDREFIASQASRNECNAKANQFVASAQAGKFGEVAQELKMSRMISDNLKIMGSDIAGIENSREIIRWAYESELNSISEPFEDEDSFVVAHLVQVIEPGYKPFDDVKSEVETIVKNDKKADILVEKFNAVKSQPIENIATSLNVSVNNQDNVNFSRGSIPNLGTEPNFIGHVFGAELNKVSGPVKGERNVFMFKVVSKTEASEPTAGLRDNLHMMNVNAAYSNVLTSLEDKAEIIDNRGKFY